MRGRAVAARRAHNPEVAGSSPAPATYEKRRQPASFSIHIIIQKLPRKARVEPRCPGSTPFQTSGLLWHLYQEGIIEPSLAESLLEDEAEDNVGVFRGGSRNPIKQPEAMSARR